MLYYITFLKKASVAQSVEQLTLNQLVDGSNPPGGTIFMNAKLRIRDSEFFDLGEEQFEMLFVEAVRFKKLLHECQAVLA